jgi:hypothetical protein
MPTVTDGPRSPAHDILQRMAPDRLEETDSLASDLIGRAQPFTVYRCELHTA